jgi:hypothetical protein
MRKLLFSAAAVAIVTSATAFAATTPASAANAPVCAMISGDAAATYCNFFTFQQCQAFVSGQGGTCTENTAHWMGAQARYIGPIVAYEFEPLPLVIDADELNPHQP